MSLPKDIVIATFYGRQYACLDTIRIIISDLQAQLESVTLQWKAANQNVGLLDKENSRLTERVTEESARAERWKAIHYRTRDRFNEKNALLRKALIDIAKVNFAGPSTDERREWTWATAYKLIGKYPDEVTKQTKQEAKCSTCGASRNNGRAGVFCPNCD